MRFSIIFLLVLFLSYGCKWRDDFRERQQPQLLEQVPEPTLNRDSDEYVGDFEALPINPDKVPLPSIDGLSIIPEVPDNPSGA